MDLRSSGPIYTWAHAGCALRIYAEGTSKGQGIYRYVLLDRGQPVAEGAFRAGSAERDEALLLRAFSTVVSAPTTTFSVPHLLTWMSQAWRRGPRWIDFCKCALNFKTRLVPKTAKDVVTR